MVIAAGQAERESEKKYLKPTTTMATVPQRSRSLHNFSSLPCFNVKWGRQKQLRCVKDSSGADHDFPTSSSSSPNHRRRSSPDIGGIEAMREKIMLEIRSEAQALQMKASILTADRRIAGDDVVVSGAAAGASKPWNLRSRRAVCKEPTTTSININNSINVAGSSDRKPSFSPAEVKSPMRTAELSGNGGRAKFSASLSKQEIEEDFLAILGTRPARRPKKRPRYVQKQIDGLFPGYWLSEITADMYKVNENPEAGKR